MQTDEKLTMSAAEVIAAVVELQTKREGQDHSFRNALYEMLGAAYPLALELGSRPEVQTAFKKLPGKGASKFEKKADAFRHVVRLVFGKTDRRRVSDYANVLVEASEVHHVRAGALRNWIDDNKGIDLILEKRRERLKPATPKVTSDTPEEKGSGSAAPLPRKDVVSFPRPADLSIEFGTYAVILEVNEKSITFRNRSSSREIIAALTKQIAQEDEQAVKTAARVQAAKEQRAKAAPQDAAA